MKPLFSDTVAADTIPLKLVVYLGLLAAILILTAQAWSMTALLLDDAKIKNQIETAALSILSIQEGYARDPFERFSPEGNICTLEFSLPPSVRYVGFGVDPDAECNGNLSDSKWVLENNTIIYQYNNGVKKRVFLEGPPVYFVEGEYNSERKWIPAVNLESNVNNESNLSLEKMAVVIESPISGTFSFEMIIHSGKRYTMSHF